MTHLWPSHLLLTNGHMFTISIYIVDKRYERLEICFTAIMCENLKKGNLRRLKIVVCTFLKKKISNGEAFKEGV